MTEIIPNLWVGNLKSRNDLHFLVSRNIMCVINCCKHDIIDRYGIISLPLNIKQVHLGIIEHGPEDQRSINSMLVVLESCYSMIDYYLNKGQSVLVHCYAGKQRSPTIIMAYLIRKCGLDPKNANHIVKTIWPYSGSDYLKSLYLYKNEQLH